MLPIPGRQPDRDLQRRHDLRHLGRGDWSADDSVRGSHWRRDVSQPQS